MAGTQVQTTPGVVTGIERDGVRTWLGIPYAAPPTGERRFRPPQPPEPWQGVRDATSYAPTAMQSSEFRLDQQINVPEPRMSEDCLYLNVWAPAELEAAQPVLVWIHGGGLVEGAGSDDQYDGATFARNGNLIVVTLNYRLGPFGYLYLGGLAAEYADSANLGLLDQLAALRWVRANIAAFGGDPDNVTVFGESAGGISIVTLLATPAARGLFHRAIVQSGGAYVHTPDQATTIAREMLDELGEHSLSRMRNIAADEIQAASERHAELHAAPLGLSFRPVIDHETLPRHPLEAIRRGGASGIALIAGSNRDEGNLWVTPAEERPKLVSRDHIRRILAGALGEERAGAVVEDYSVTPKGLSRALSDAFRANALAIASAQRPHAPVWVYRFDWSSPMQELVHGAAHALEVAFVWNTLHTPFGREFSGGDPGALPLADLMHRSWIAFARSGVPNVDGLALWPTFQPKAPMSMLFDSQPRVARVD